MIKLPIIFTGNWLSVWFRGCRLVVGTIATPGHGQYFLQDFPITVNSPTPHSQPDITLVDKQHGVVKLISWG